MSMQKRSFRAALALFGFAASASALNFNVDAPAGKIGEETGIAVPESAAAAKAPEAHGMVAAGQAALPVQAFVGKYELSSGPDSCLVATENSYTPKARPKGLIVTSPTLDSIAIETISSPRSYFQFSEPWWFDGGSIEGIRGINRPVTIDEFHGTKCSVFVFGLCDKERKYKDIQAAYTTSDSLVFFHEEIGHWGFRYFWILRFPNTNDPSTLTYQFQIAKDHDYKRPDRGTVIASCTLKRVP